MESVVEFGPSRSLVGVLTRPPAGAPARDVAVLITNSGIIHRVGANRLHVRLARFLAANGYPCFRYDLPGIGDSEGGNAMEGVERNNLSATRAAVDAMSSAGVAQRFVMVGICSGANHSFQVACMDARIAGAVLIDPTVMFATSRHRMNRILSMVRRGLKPIVWWRLVTGRYRVVQEIRHTMHERAGPGAPTLLDPGKHKDAWSETRAAFQQLIARQVQLFMVITKHNLGVYSYQRQIFDTFTDMPELENVVQVICRASADHTFSAEAERRHLESNMLDWLNARAAPRPAPPG